MYYYAVYQFIYPGEVSAVLIATYQKKLLLNLKKHSYQSIFIHSYLSFY
jgi:hypothetical protein